MSWLDDLGDWFSDVGESFFGNPSTAWDRFRNGRTNESAEEIADENLSYQRERNEIEDARYEDETAYNRAFEEDERDYQRAFAENQRDYERALQQQIFDREDTAIERQANSLSKLGINPLSQNMSGLGAGQAVSAGGAPSASVAPSASARGGSALHNDFRMQDMGVLQSITPILSLANGVSNLNTQGFQRDKLREEADYQRLKNEEQALINADLAKKLNTEQDLREEDLRHKKENNPNIERDSEATANRNQREDKFQETYGVQDGTDRYVLLATDAANQTQRASDYVSDKVGDLSKSATKSLVDRAKDGLKAYDRATRKIQDGIVSGFKKFGKKVNDFGNKYLGANY